MEKSVKKSKGWKMFDFGPETKIIESKSPIKDSSKIMDKQIRNDSTVTKRNFNFHDNLTPRTVSDLAVHPKKIQEVEDWLKSNICNYKHVKNSQFLLLSGPTGSGKTTTVNVLCKIMGISIYEWVNPVDQDFDLCKGPSQANKFVEFLTESKWNSLFDIGNDKKVTLVKDFPNVVVHHPEEFYTILEECYYKPTYPVIFICTETSNNNINLPRTLFPDEIINKYNITHICFNACAHSVMKIAIKRAQLLMNENADFFKQLSASTIDAILSSAMGDIRNAINQFYFASLLGSDELPVSNKEKVGCKRKRNQISTTTVKCMLRDENLGLFHGLGRVLNPKRKEVNNSWRLVCDVKKLVDEFSTRPAIFISFLFENYLKYFNDINDVCRAAEILSISVKFLDNRTDRHETLIFALWISILGLMIYNEHKVSKWNQIRGPTKTNKCANKSIEVVGLNSTDYFYYNFIRKTDNFHAFKV